MRDWPLHSQESKQTCQSRPRIIRSDCCGARGPDSFEKIARSVFVPPISPASSIGLRLITRRAIRPPRGGPPQRPACAAAGPCLLVELGNWSGGSGRPEGENKPHRSCRLYANGLRRRTITQSGGRFVRGRVLSPVRFFSTFSFPRSKLTLLPQ